MIATGGCLCGAIRYTAIGLPQLAGLCFCSDCRKASGSGFIPFMGYDAISLSFSGSPRQHRSLSARGTEAVRNFCGECGSLVFGGIVGLDTAHTIYAGTLDDPTNFVPAIGIFGRDRPAWVAIPPGITVFETLPDTDPSA